MLSAHPRCRFCWPVPSLLASRSCRGARTEGLHWWPAERTTPKHTRKTVIYCHGHAEATRENQVLLFIPDSVVWGKTPVFWASSICQSRNVRGLPEKRCDARSRFSHVYSYRTSDPNAVLGLPAYRPVLVNGGCRMSTIGKVRLSGNLGVAALPPLTAKESFSQCYATRVMEVCPAIRPS